ALGVASFVLFLGLGHDSPLLDIGLALGLFGLSQGLSKAPSIALIMNAAPSDAKNDLAGILSLCRSLSIALGVLFFETIFSEAIPAGISQNDTHIAAAIAHPRELAAGFTGDFVFGILVSLLAVGFMIAARDKPPA
ncbi:MAG: hypothetical protein K4445_04640, partial [Deltaproteobacteria bacterium]